MTNQKQAQEIIDKFVDGISRTQLALEHSICRATVGNILLGRSYKTCIRPSNINDLIRNEKRRKCKSLPPFTKLQNDILIGSLLGDGNLHKICGNQNSHFTKPQSYPRKKYLEWHFNILSKYSNKLYCHTGNSPQKS